MVLQRNAPIRIWGDADPGEKLTITLAEQSIEVEADREGQWRAELAAMEMGGPHEIKVSGGEASVVFKDVMVGEVWICSGQSNMAWSIEQITSGSDSEKEKVFASLRNPRLRLFQVERSANEKPQADFTKNENWLPCESENGRKFSAVAYHFGNHLLEQLDSHPNYQDKELVIGLINSSWGGSACEAWISQTSLQSDESLQPLLDHFQDKEPSKANPATLYNGMIAPLTAISIRGVIWYQGEANVGRAHQYETLFPMLIRDWRARFGQGDFPFYFVQLAPFRYRGEPDELPEIWDVQRRTLLLPNTGMAVTTDIGNIKDIHPRNKQEVGRRLALWALVSEYGMEGIEYSGPLYESMEIVEGKVRLRFQHVAEGLFSDDEDQSDFLVCGEDRQFHPAEIRIDGDCVEVWSDKVEVPLAVRFGWTDTSMPRLKNSIGLPASPFRTDNFKSKSEGRHF